MADNGFNPNSPFGQAMRNAGMDSADAEAYDGFRTKYFNDRIANRLKPAEREKHRQAFLQRTQRPQYSVAKQIGQVAGIAAASGFSTLEKTLSTVTPDKMGGNLFREAAKKDEALVEQGKKGLDWRGQHGSSTADFAGGAAAYGIETAVGGRLVKPLAAAPMVGPAVKAGMKAFPKLLPVVGRTLGFSTLMGLEAEPGKRTSAFTTGMAWGAGGELVGATLGRMWKYYKGRKALPTPKEVDDLLKDMAIDQAPDTQAAKDVHQAFGEDIAAVSREPGYLSNARAVLDDKLSHPLVTFEDAEGRQRISPIPANHGVEKAYASVKEAIDGKWKLSQISHNEFDTDFVNELMAKLKENYEPWSSVSSQIATNAANKGIDIGGGTARIDSKVLKFRYAKAMPAPQEARHFIEHAIGEAKGSRAEAAMKNFESVWNPFGNWMERSEAAAKLEELGLHDILPTPETRAKWKPSEGMNLPAIFNEKGWYDTIDNWKGRTEEGGEIKLDLRQKQHLTNAMKTLWDSSIPTNSTPFKSALRALTQYELSEFLPGALRKEEVASLLNEGRAGTEGQARAGKLVDEARTRPAVAMREHLYQQISRLTEIFSKQKDVDTIPYVKQYGRQTVDAAMNMAGLMWERSKGDLLQVKWDEDLLKQGIREGILPPIDPSGKPLTQWFDKGEEHLAQGLGIDDTSSLKKASLESRVLRLAEMYNVDPKNIDKELLAEVGEAEVARAKEIADSARKSNVSVYDRSVMEEAARLGKFDDSAFMPRSLPPSEHPSFEPGEPSGMPTRSIKLADGSIGQFAYSVKRAASGLPSRLYVMFNDAIADKLSWQGTHLTNIDQLDQPVVQKDLQTIADMNGIDLSKTAITMVHRPNKGFTKALSAPLVWHEDGHGMLTQIGFGSAIGAGKSLRNSEGAIPKLLTSIREGLPKRLQDTWDAFGNAIEQRHASLYGPNVKAEEGFMHAATAIRFGNHGDIAHFAAVDTNVEQVYETVQAVASKLRQEAGKMAPGSSKTFIMDRLGLIENFSNIDRYKATKEVAEQMFADVGEDFRSLQHLGGMQFFEKFSSIIDKAEGSLEGRIFSPSYTSWAEAAGARHALYPTQMPPGRTPLPMPETGIEEGWHFVPVAQAMEKTLGLTKSWVNFVDKKLNEKFSTQGAYLPLADRVEAVLQNHRAGEAWLDTNKKAAAEFLVGGKGKLESFGYLMTKDPKFWSSEIQKLGFNNDEIAHFKNAYAWMKKLQADTGLPIMNYYLEEYGRLARRDFNPLEAYNEKDPSKFGAFQRLVTEGTLNPRDLHLGHMVNILLREGMEKKFTGEALKGLREVLNKKADGKYILGDLREPLQRFHDYMRGMPDNGGKMLSGLTKGLTEAINTRLAIVNKSLPARFRKGPLQLGDFVNRLILLNYVANIGAKPALAIRDSAQILITSLPVLGPRTLMKGMLHALDPANKKMAIEAGATLKGRNVEEVFGDVFNELPAQKNYFDKGLQLASNLLAPSRWGHNFARRIVFAGVYDDALKALPALRKGPVTPQTARKFYKDTGLWFADTARQKQLLSLASDKYVPKHEIAKQIALEANDLTLWAYRKGTQPAYLRTTVGRIFGQYSYWPANYANYVVRLVSKVKEYPEMALPALATFIAVNYEMVVETRKHFGVDVSKWFGISPFGYVGSPHLQFTIDSARTVESYGASSPTNEQKQARKRVKEYPLQFVPGSGELRNIKDNWGKPLLDDNGHLSPAAWKMLGFKEFKPNEPVFEPASDLLEPDK